MKNVDPTKREEYRLKMVELQEQAGVYRKKLDYIDKLASEDQYKKLIGKAFEISRDTMQDSGYVYSTYFKVMHIDDNFEIRGISITICVDKSFYENGLIQYNPNEVLEIQLNAHGWKDTLEDACEMSDSEFNSILELVRKAISSL